MSDSGEVTQAETVLHALFPTRLFLLRALRVQNTVDILCSSASGENVKTKKPPSTVLPRDYSSDPKVRSAMVFAFRRGIRQVT